MRNLLLSLAGLALLAGTTDAQTKVDSQENSKSHDQKRAAPVVVPLSVGTAFNAALTTPLDARHNQAGDTFTAEIKETVHYQRSVIFPRGTILYGHLVRRSTGGHGQAASALFVQFDKAVLKNGQEAALNAGIQAIAASKNEKTPMDNAPNEDAPQIRDDDTRNVPRETSLNADSALHVVGAVDTSVEDSPIKILLSPTNNLPMTQGEFTKNGLFAPDSQGALGMPEVKVYTPLSEGSAGTVFLSTKKNLHFDAGTRLLIVIQTPRPAASTDGPDSIE